MKAQILIVEDEYAIALHLSTQLEKLGHTVVDICQDFKDAFAAAVEFDPNLILMDINLNKEKDGIEIAQTISEKLSIPIIFCTALSDRETFRSAMKAKPMGFINKPYTIEELKNNIQRVMYQVYNPDFPSPGMTSRVHSQTKEDFIFIKVKNQLVKVSFSEIIYVESLDNYIKIFCLENKTLVTLTYLGDFYAKLPKDQFLRVHRSYIVSIDKINTIETNTNNLTLSVGDYEKEISIGRSYKKEIQNRFN